MTEYWTVLSGDRQNNIWDIIEDQSLVGIGWPGIGNVRGVSFDAIKEGVQQHFPHRHAGTDAGMLDSFANEMELGDIVLTTIGSERRILIGRITGEYTYADSPAHYLLSHTRAVEWLRADIDFDTYRKHGMQFYGRTVRRITQYSAAVEAMLNREELEETTNAEDDVAPIRFRLEQDLQDVLRESITQLEPGLVITDGGREQKVEAGWIDITARDSADRIVVIELKAGTAQPDSVAQILAYMGTVPNHDGRAVRGILVANDFHPRVQAALRAVPNVTLKAYSFKFTFQDPE